MTDLVRTAVESQGAKAVEQKAVDRAWSDEGTVWIKVSDTGPGLSAEIRARLFQPFVTARKKNGLGLGLALARQTMLQRGGDL